tara:strand:+ start:2852 stop:3238 length:387 start_codon:yes stop_codon:yes gene_type:complete
MNHLCCQTCLTFDTDDEKPYIGFHSQDNDRIPESGYTFLTHGPPTCEHDTLADGVWSKRAVEVIESMGLTVEWDGTMATRIKVLLPETMPLDLDQLRDDIERRAQAVADAMVAHPQEDGTVHFTVGAV